MKIIFLDIDGVLNSFDNMRSYHPYERRHYDKFHKFDSRCVRWLKRIIKETDSEIVISSSMRRLQHFDEMWDGRALPEFVGKTGRTEGHRGAEIDLFLKNFSQPVENYVILDDDSDMMPYQLDRFVKIDGSYGLNYWDHLKAIKILNDPPKQMLFDFIGAIS